jgi:MOSC domain-containing protein YiiM
MAHVANIRIKKQKGAPMQSIPAVTAVTGGGLEGDIHVGATNRAVSFLGSELTELKVATGGLCQVKFTENITTADAPLYQSPVGTSFHIGDAIFGIEQVGKECFENCAVFTEKGGCALSEQVVFARVIKGGDINKDDEIIFE